MIATPTNDYVSEELQKLGQLKHQPLYTAMSKEEHDEVLEKMVALVHQPAGHLPQQDELYLEQQLTDMLGFEVSAELEGQRLNHSIGIMAAQQHLRRFPTDTLTDHDEYREAGLSAKRSRFGWFTLMGQLTPQTIAQEKYYFSVQADLVPSWHHAYDATFAWYKLRKMIVINPVEKKAAVGVVGNIGPADWMQRQFGGSPEIIREAGIWSLASQGHVFLLFVNDPENQVPLGPMNLELS